MTYIFKLLDADLYCLRALPIRTVPSRFQNLKLQALVSGEAMVSLVGYGLKTKPMTKSSCENVSNHLDSRFLVYP